MNSKLKVLNSPFDLLKNLDAVDPLVNGQSGSWSDFFRAVYPLGFQKIVPPLSRTSGTGKPLDGYWMIVIGRVAYWVIAPQQGGLQLENTWAKERGAESWSEVPWFSKSYCSVSSSLAWKEFSECERIRVTREWILSNRSVHFRSRNLTLENEGCAIKLGRLIESAGPIPPLWELRERNGDSSAAWLVWRQILIPLFGLKNDLQFLLIEGMKRLPGWTRIFSSSSSLIHLPSEFGSQRALDE